MRVLKIIGASIAVLLVSALLFIGWLWWESKHPTLPRGWPPDSVWIRASDSVPGRVGLLAVGGWVGCQLDTQRNVDMCEFANFRGKLWYKGDYTTCDGRPPITDEQLWLKPGHHQSAAFVFLRDGRVLFPQDECDFRNNSNSLQSPPAVK